METIHFFTDGQVGVHLTADELPSGDLRLLRVYQSATHPQEPDVFVLRADERRDLRDYLSRRRPGEKPPARERTLIAVNGANEEDLGEALTQMADAFYAADERAGKFDGLTKDAVEFRYAFRIGAASALTKMVQGQLMAGVMALPIGGPAPQQVASPTLRIDLLHADNKMITVCACPEATDEEILALCNRDHPRMPSWCRVVHEGANVPTVLWPRPCSLHPGRVHCCVLAE
jgi:hypothetical protein